MTEVQTQTCRHGFTLVELLVIIALTSILALLTASAVHHGLDEAMRVHCLNNLKEMTRSAHLYASHHQGALPPAYRRDFDTGETKTWESFLWDNAPESPIQQCPVFHGSANWDDEYTGYNYNASFVGGYELIRKGARLANSRPSIRTSMIQNPSECALFGDGEFAKGANKFMRSPYPGPNDTGTTLAQGGTQGYRHRGRTNVGFADGHVASVDQVYPAPGKSSLSSSAYGFLSPDNRLYDLE
ncbi:MAG: prepilin-type N-terminal cleavage/methylation domain-containing protein [Verrucomicrobia bacterium]|nr:prepilin-type N-terminal cleavage/methylation domain-containing protein [Kiritimatiellia bacterium]MCP5488045.1 prepilin-type N-terminal cleavage/methylation domain-containing protein [Verrucomicrobiota bacterium]